MNTTSEIPLADQRTAEILASARLAFAEKGFDGASMQDLARKSGMSVGNFYRYFPSKAAIVDALIALDLAEIEQDFAHILCDPDPIKALRATIAQRISNSDCQEDGRIWAEISAAALRKQEIGEAAFRMEAEIARHLVTIFARASGLAFDKAAALWTAHAQLVVMLVKSCAMRPPEPASSNDLTQLVMRMINGLLDDITTFDAAKG